VEQIESIGQTFTIIDAVGAADAGILVDVNETVTVGFSPNP
jgi:hypothetical protein